MAISIASPSSLASGERGSDCEGGHEPRCVVAQRDGSKIRLTLGRARGSQSTGAGEVVDVVAGPPGQGPIGAVTANRAADDASVDRGESGVVDAEPLSNPRPDTRDDDISVFKQLPKLAPGGLGLQVERNAPLVAVNRVKEIPCESASGGVQRA